MFQLSVNGGVSTSQVTITVNPLAPVANLDKEFTDPKHSYNYYLGQNYPNPVSHKTKIRYSIPVKSIVEIILFDFSGNQVKVLVNEVKEAGAYAYHLDVSNLAKGIYYYRMRSGNYLEVKTIVIQ